MNFKQLFKNIISVRISDRIAEPVILYFMAEYITFKFRLSDKTKRKLIQNIINNPFWRTCKINSKEY